mgnify:CR=1 FL=1
MFKAKYIPNAITSARILCVPCLIWMLFNHQFERSLILVFFMGVSDALDGFVTAGKQHWVPTWIRSLIN